jgi:hypothetical protein
VPGNCRRHWPAAGGLLYCRKWTFTGLPQTAAVDPQQSLAAADAFARACPPAVITGFFLAGAARSPSRARSGSYLASGSALCDWGFRADLFDPFEYKAIGFLIGGLRASRSGASAHPRTSRAPPSFSPPIWPATSPASPCPSRGPISRGKDCTRRARGEKPLTGKADRHEEAS